MTPEQWEAEARRLAWYGAFDVIVDFSDPALAGRTIVLENDAPTPFPGGESPDTDTAGVVMAFRVVKARSDVPDSVLPARLRRRSLRWSPRGATTRQLLLAEEEDGHGRVLPLLGTATEGPLRWDDTITEAPRLNSTEI